MKYNVISTCDYLQEAPHAWTSRMSRLKWGDNIPQVRRDADGTDGWYFHGERVPGGVGDVSAALNDRISAAIAGPTRWEEVPAITYIPTERVKAMDKDGVDVHTLFANVAGAAGGSYYASQSPEEFRLAAIQAYNDYQVEEWATAHPGRFIALAQVPLWDVQLALAELQRTAKLGVQGITFALPQRYGFPHIADPYWDPLWGAAQEAGLSINLHVGSGETQGLGPLQGFAGASSRINLAFSGARAPAANGDVLSTILFSAVLERFPKLKFVFSESGLGWVPCVLELADHNWKRMGPGLLGRESNPSEMFRRQCYVNFTYEVLGVQVREVIGTDNILWQSNFPHASATWPTSQDRIQQGMAGLSPEERRKLLVDSAVTVFNLDPN